MALAPRLLLSVIKRSWYVWPIWVGWGALIIYSAWLDGVLTLGAGRTLRYHYGFQALFLVGPIVWICTFYSRDYFLVLVKNLISRQHEDERDNASKAIKPHISSILLENHRTVLILFFLCTLGFIFALINTIWLFNPIERWHQDVFNAKAHPYSFVVANAYLFILWSVIYPFAIFYTFHIAWSLKVIARTFLTNNMILLDPLHPDGHGGMRDFETLNIPFVIYLLPALSLLALRVTNRYDYFSSIGGATFFSILFFAQCAIGLRWIARATRTERDKAVADWNERIQRLMQRKGLGATEALIALKYRDCLLAVKLFPYAPTAAIAVNILMFLPAPLAIVQMTKGS